jgi:hypothetical protein
LPQADELENKGSTDQGQHKKKDGKEARGRAPFNQIARNPGYGAKQQHIEVHNAGAVVEGCVSARGACGTVVCAA